MGQPQDECDSCSEHIRARIKSFDREYHVIGARLVSAVFLADVEHVYPGLLELLTHPWEWLGELGEHWFPIDPAVLAQERICIEAVVAPLPFIAAVVRVVCPRCRLSHRFIIVSVNFWAYLTHFSAYLSSMSSSPDELALFIKDLKTTAPNWSNFVCPSYVYRDIVTSGMAWILCHEIGHFANPQFPFRKVQHVPEYVVDHLNDEIQADSNAFSVLLYRERGSRGIAATGAIPLAGISLVLRAWNAMIPTRQNRHPSILAYGDRVGSCTPSPTLRWSAVKENFDLAASLGLASDSHYKQIESSCFVHPESKTEKLWESFYVHGISF